MTELSALVTLLRRPRVRWSEIALDVQESGGAGVLLDRAISQPDALFPVDPISAADLIADAAEEITGWRADGIGVHAFFDDDYPASLRDIREMPPILFTRGKILAYDPAIAVIGSREASPGGLRIATSIAASLTRRNITVASGLAKGIDTAAHVAALDAGGRTVAVLGTGIRQHYPAANRKLQEHIADAGLVISQFWPDAPPAKQNFPIRNAIMSGYSMANIVVEAGEQSGARIQARLALHHGRPVVLTSHAMQAQWAKDFARNPGVYVVSGLAELHDAVTDIMSHFPTGAA